MFMHLANRKIVMTTASDYGDEQTCELISFGGNDDVDIGKCSNSENDCVLVWEWQKCKAVIKNSRWRMPEKYLFLWLAFNFNNKSGENKSESQLGRMSGSLTLDIRRHDLILKSIKKFFFLLLFFFFCRPKLLYCHCRGFGRTCSIFFVWHSSVVWWRKCIINFYKG